LMVPLMRKTVAPSGPPAARAAASADAH